MKKVVVILLAICCLLVFCYAITPLRGSEFGKTNHFILDSRFKDVRKALRDKDIQGDVVKMNGAEVVYEDIIHQSLNITLLEDWEYRMIKNIGVKIDGTVIHLRNDIYATDDSIEILTTLRQHNTSLGVRQFRGHILIEPYGNQTVVKHSVLIFVVRRCPPHWQSYMDEKVRESVFNDLRAVEYLMRKYIEGG